MAELQVLTQFSELFENVQLTLQHYNENIRNNLFDKRDNETNDKAYKRGETIFDQFDENLNNINQILEKEQEIAIFFAKCKENKQQIISYKNELITKLLQIKKEELPQEEYVNWRTELNKKRIETPDEKNRRECEEMYEEMKEMIIRLKQEREYFKKEIEIVREERKKFSIEDEFTQLSNQFVKIDKLNELISQQNETVSNFLKKDDIDSLSNEFVRKSMIPKTIDRELQQLYLLTSSQMDQLEEWTELKCSDVLFDSTVDNWSCNSSVFDERIIGKKQLVFVIEDTDGEKFGYYLNTEITDEYGVVLPTDDKSFLFNLQSKNNRLSKPMIFKLLNEEYGYRLWDKQNKSLIYLGDIVLFKEHKKTECYCFNSEYFNYCGIKNALSGKTAGYFNGNFRGNKFTIKRLVVIEMN